MDPRSLSLRGYPRGREKLPQKVSGSGLVACKMVGKDGLNGKRWKTSKGLKMKKTVCKSCLNMFIFSMLFYSLKAPSLQTGSLFLRGSCCEEKFRQVVCRSKIKVTEFCYKMTTSVFSSLVV